MTGSMINEMGGEGALRSLVETFYDIIEATPEGAQIRKLHKRGHGMQHARTEQFNFLSGFLGGQRYYAERYGHMNVKLMHEHVPITLQDAENWLLCMDKALEVEGISGAYLPRLRDAFRRVALILVNDLPDE